MAKPNETKPKTKGYLDKFIHGGSDHGTATQAEESAVEDDVPIDPVPQAEKKSDVSKHHHKKFDKFKKGI